MTLESHLPALQVILPLLTAPIVALLRPRHLAWAATLATSAMSFALSVALTAAVLADGVIRYDMGGWPAPYGIELVVDELSALVLLLITGASTVALLAGRDSIAGHMEPHRQPLYYAAWLTALAGLAGIAVTGDAFNAFVFMEISSLATYVLIAGGADRRALTSVFKYLVVGTVGATFYLIGTGLVYMMTGTLNFSDMHARLGDAPAFEPVLVAAAFVTIGLVLKAAVFPLHVWLPNAYAYAPHPATVFIAACSTKVSLYVLLRFDFTVFQMNLGDHVSQLTYFLLPLAVGGILFGSLVAMFEGHVKRLLGYSSVAQIGYIVLGAALASHASLTAGLLHMFNHALAKGALFLAVLALASRTGGLELTQLRGIGRQMPWTMSAFALAAASLVGIPGTAGFVSKWYLISAAMAEGPGGALLVMVILVSSLMALAYLWKILEPAWFGEPEGPAPAVSAREPLAPVLVLWLVALANVYFGLEPALPLTLAQDAATLLMNGGGS